MSNRKGADLGLTLVNLGYVLPTPASIGAAKNTVGAGLPVFLGRTVGDNHFESGAARGYVLTGASGGSVTEPFAYVDGSLVGQVAPNGQTWVAGGTYAVPAAGAGSPAITSGACVLPDSSTRTALLNVGSFASGGEIKIKASESATNPAGQFNLELGGKTTDYSKIYVRINCNDPGVFGQGVGRTFITFMDAAGTSTTVADNGSNAAGFGLRTDMSIEVMLRVLADGTVQVYFDGVLKLSGAITTAQLATLGAYVGVGGNAITLDDLATLAAGTLAWTPGSTLTALGYVAPTTASIGACKSTVGAGLPAIAGRAQGDLHRNSTDGNEYVLTGAYAASDSDNFNRANGAVGSTPAPNSRAYVADGSGGTRPTISNQTVVQRVNSVRGGHLINVGSVAAGGFVQATVHQGATYGTDLSSATLFLGTGTAPDGPSDATNGGWLCNINAANSGGAGIMDLVGPDGVVVNSASAAANVITANETATFVLEVSPDGKTGKVYKNGVLIVSRTVAAAATGTYAGFQLAAGAAGATGTSYLDDFSVSVGGTVAWTQTPATPTLAGLGYVTPTPASIGAAKNTVGAGFPSFAGRSQGDNHLNLTDGREYVLTGAPGVPVKSESFTGRANGASIVGTPLEVGGVNWVGSDSASAPTVTSGLIRATSSDDMGAFHALAAGAQDVQADLTFVQLGFCQFGIRCTSGVRASGYWLVMNSAGVKLYKGGVSTLVATFSAVAVTNGQFRLTIDGSATPTITAYKDGVQIGTPYTDISGSPQVGAAVGWELGQGNGGSITTLDNWSALAIGSLAWTSPIAGGSLNYRGAWASGMSYTTNDVVSRAYGLYVALTIPPAGTDPVTPLGAPARVGANGGDIASGASNFGGAVTDQSFAWPFTVSGPTTVTAVEVLVATTGNIPAGVKVGIASDFASGRTGGAPFLGSHVTTAAMTPGWNTVVLDTPVPLVAGTTYRYVLESGDIRNLQYAGSAGPYTGLVASTNTGLASSGAPSTTYGSTVGLYAPFRIDASPTQYWQKLANTGNQENVGQVAAAGATLTIPDPELQSITRAVLTANVVVALPTVKAGESFTVILVQDATGGRTVSWTGGATVLWPGGTAPTQTATAGKGDAYEFFADGGGNWLGRALAQNY